MITDFKSIKKGMREAINFVRQEQTEAVMENKTFKLHINKSNKSESGEMADTLDFDSSLSRFKS